MNRFPSGTYAILSFLFFLSINAPGIAQPSKPNYDELKVPAYTLPSLLITQQGKPVTTTKQWEKIRRKEILQLFEEQVYGKTPNQKIPVRFEVTSTSAHALNGKATRKEITAHFGTDVHGPKMYILLYIPNNRSKPAPAFVGMNFYGNHTIWNDPEISLAQGWVNNNQVFNINEHKATETSRGVRSSRWPVDKIIARGYALATIYYGDLDPDFDDGFQNGIHPLFYKKGQQTPAANEWGSIGAWAWGMSRAMDYLEKDKDINAKQVALMGHSRIGKAALWAGAMDNRFAVVIANNSGCGGAALSMRSYGETVGAVNTAFPHWFCDNFNQYNNNEGKLPVDQHMLIALMAPRPVYIASAEDDTWADPKGEFLSGVHASPVYTLYNLKGLEGNGMPGIHQPIMNPIGYHIRAGKHDVTNYDWERYMDFADKFMR